MHWGRSFAVGRRRWLAAVTALAVALAAGAAQAETQIFSLFDFQFEDGTVAPELHLAYETQGMLTPARDNAILLLPDTLGDRHAFDALVGPGKVFDTSRFFVIAVDVLGGGESTSPGDGTGQDFPRYTIRDLMAAEYALVSRGLGLTRLRAIVGWSMGADIALEWAIHHPEMPLGIVLLAPSPRSDANFRVIVDLLTASIARDPDWNGGHYERNPVEGLRHAGMIYYPWAVSAAHLDGIGAVQLAQEAEDTAKTFATWDANSLVLRYAACRGHDVAAPFAGDMGAALAKATMPGLLLPSASDRLIGLAGAGKLRAALPQATYTAILGDGGHRAIFAPPGTPEGDAVAQAIRGFLK